MIRKLFLAVCLGIGFFSLFLVLGSAQDPPPPPQPAGQTDEAQPEAVGEGEGEVYNRGPIHDAFAIPGSNDPVKGSIVEKEPPDDIDELPPDQQPEGENIVWISGYWAYDGELDDFLWVSGVWRDIPPGRTWIPGYWATVEGGFQWIAGNWAEADVEEIAYLPEPPASQEVGPSSPSPGEEYFWVPGSWVYGDRYQWRTGYWAPHQEDWVWIPARHTFTPFGFIYTPGYWDFLPAYRGLAFAPVYFRRHRPVHYTPVVAIESWHNLSLTLFVGPGHGTYYYGDYFGPSYVSGGYVPFFEYHRHHHGHDPFFVYNRWRFGNDYEIRLAGWHGYFRDHEDYRPRRTFRAHRDFAARHRGNEAVALTMVSADLNEVVRSKKLAVGIRTVSKEQKERYTKQARKLREFTKERVEEEKKDIAKTDGNEKSEKQGKARRRGIRVRGNDKLAMPTTDASPKKGADQVDETKADGGKADEGNAGETKRRRIEVPDVPNKLKKRQPKDGEGKSTRTPRTRDVKKGEPEQVLPEWPAAPPDSAGTEKKETEKKATDKGDKGKPDTSIPRRGKKLDKSDGNKSDKTEKSIKKLVPGGKSGSGGKTGKASETPQLDIKKQRPAMKNPPKVDVPKKVDTQRKVDTPKKVDVPKKVDTQKKIDVPKKVDAAKKVDIPKKIDVPKKIEPPKADKKSSSKRKSIPKKKLPTTEEPKQDSKDSKK